MAGLKLVLDADGAWPELAKKIKQGTLQEGTGLQIARLEKGMKSGKSSVMIRMELNDGTTVLGETSMELFLTCARAFTAVEQDCQPPPETLN